MAPKSKQYPNCHFIRQNDIDIGHKPYRSRPYETTSVTRNVHIGHRLHRRHLYRPQVETSDAFTKNSSINRKEKYTDKQKYTLDRNENRKYRNKE